MASHEVDWQQVYPSELRGGAVAIGKFDGVHLGHAALLARTVEHARLVNGPAIVMTFEPHPLQLLRPEQPVLLLSTLAERAELLHQLGADHVVILRTTRHLLNLTAVEFFNQVLIERLGVRALVEGPDFRFGRGREGDVTVLRQLCDNAKVTLSLVPPVIEAGAEVSSGRVRSAVLSGDVITASRLLGRPYRISGVVGRGREVGRTIGFPTANVEQVATVIPADGVYAARVHCADGAFAAAVNVGPAPTFAERARRVEAHLLQYNGDLYGERLTVEFVERLREVRPFAGVGELIGQLQRDVARVRDVVRL